MHLRWSAWLLEPVLLAGILPHMPLRGHGSCKAGGVVRLFSLSSGIGIGPSRHGILKICWGAAAVRLNPIYLRKESKLSHERNGFVVDGGWSFGGLGGCALGRIGVVAWSTFVLVSSRAVESTFWLAQKSRLCPLQRRCGECPPPVVAVGTEARVPMCM